MPSIIGALLVLIASVLGCAQQEAETPESRVAERFRSAAILDEVQESIALLSVHQVSSDEAFIAGGGTDPTSGVIFRRTVTGLRKETIPPGPTLWWIWGNQSGELWACGDGGRILRRIDQDQWVAETTPLESNTILYGIWGDDDGHLFAVGGSYRLNGEQNIILTSSGNGTWTRLEIESPPEPYTFFKVWGHDPTWIVGDLGWVTQIKGNATTYTQSEAGQVLFTVHGHDETVLAVGGQAEGQIYGLQGPNVIRQQIPSVAALNGLYVREDGWRIAAGEGGLVLMSSNGSSWVGTQVFPEALEGRTIHGVASRDMTLMVGGDLRLMNKGFLVSVPSVMQGEQNTQ